MKKIRKGDEVQILAGRDKGKRGSVIRVFPNDKILVEGVNIVKRHTKADPQAGTAGGVIEKEAPIFTSKVALFNPNSQKADRVGFRTLKDGKKVRFFKSNDEVVDS